MLKACGGHAIGLAVNFTRTRRTLGVVQYITK